MVRLVMALITVVLPAEVFTWRPIVFPGTPGVGCICPAYQPWPGQLVYDDGCLVHTCEVRAAYQKFLGIIPGPW